MSQEKVDYNKKQKKNRKKLNRQAKIKRIVSSICFTLVLLAACGWIGFSAYSNHTKNKELEEAAAGPSYTPVNLTAISDYLSSLTAEE